MSSRTKAEEGGSSHSQGGSSISNEGGTVLGIERGPARSVSSGPANLAIFQYGIHPLSQVPVPGYLIEMTDGRWVLIDTGFPQSQECITRHVHRFRATPEDHVTRRLATVELTPSDIDFVICSHFDPDHCGGNDLFAHAELFVQKQQYEVARSGEHWRFELYRSHWDHPTLQYTLIEGDREVLPGIWLIKTSGHVPGHQSVMLELQNSRKILLTIDAAPRAEVLSSKTGIVHAFDMDPTATRQSVEKLRSIIQQNCIDQVIYGHDARQWPQLLKAPAVYR